MALLNFVDRVGPAVPASYLNELDRIRNVVTVPSTLDSLLVAAAVPVTLQTVGSGVTGTLNLNSALPQLNFFETDAAANFGRWKFQAQGQVFTLGTMTDAGVTTTAFTVNRTAGTGVASDITVPVTGIFTRNRTAALEHALQVTSNNISISLVETGAAANNGRWSFTVDGEAFSMFALADNELTGTAFLEVQRTGTVIDTVNINGQLVALTAQSAGPATSSIYINNNAPALGFREGDAAADNRLWDLIANGAQLNFRVATDAGAAQNFWTIDRSAGAATNLSWFTNGSERCRLAGGGQVYFPGAATTGSAANAVLNNGSSPANELLRSTSSLRYKTDIQPLDVSDLDKVLDLEPITYRSICESDDKNLRWYGFIAEKTAEILPKLVNYTRLEKDGELVPDGVQYERISVLLLAKMQQQEQRIAFLEEQLERLLANRV